MTTRTFAFATIGIAALLLPAGAVAAGSMSRADFDHCNEHAMQAAGVTGSRAPSALPSTSSSSGGPSGSVSGGTAGQSGTSCTGSSIGSTGESFFRSDGGARGEGRPSDFLHYSR